MTTPTIHGNGTSAAELRDLYTAAYRAVTEAGDVLAKTGPSGRDYYPQGPDAIQRATMEHRARQTALSNVAEELMELAIYCGDMVKK